MGKLTDILQQHADPSNIEALWNSTQDARSSDGVPSGEYIADIIKGEIILSNSKKTPGYQLTFEIFEGKHSGERFRHTCWLTESAMPYTRRDLSKIGVTNLRELDRPLPVIFRCKVRLAQRKDDVYGASIRVTNFTVLEEIEIEPDPFAPDPVTNASGGNGRDDGAKKIASGELPADDESSKKRTKKRRGKKTSASGSTCKSRLAEGNTSRVGRKPNA